MNLYNPQTKAPIIFATILALTVFFAPSLLFEGESLIPSPHGPWIDPGPPGWINYSTAQVIHNALSEGTIPLWSEKIGIGVPLLADPHNAYLSPFSIILYVWPNSYGWDASLLLKVVCGLAGVFTLARALGLSSWIAAWTSALFMFSGHVFQFLHHFHTNSLVFMPWCLAGLVYGLSNQIRRALLLIGLSLPLMFFGGGLLDVVLLLLFASLASLLFVLLPDGETKTTTVIGRSQRVVLLAAMFLIGIAVAAIWILPYLELRQVSVPPRPDRSTALYNDYWYAIGLFVNKIMAAPQSPSHWLMKEKQYMSILLVPGLLLGLYTLLSERSQHKYFYLALVIYALTHFLKLYGFEPLQLINQVPVLRDIRFEKYIGLYTLGFCMLSAYGYQHFLVQKDKSTPGFIGVVAACFLTVAAVLLYAYHAKVKDLQPLAGYFVIAIFPSVLYGYFLMVRKLNHTVVISVVTFVVFFNLYLDTDTKFESRKNLFANNPLYERAKSLSDTGRILPMAGRDARIWSAYGVNDIRNISVVHTERYHKFFKQYVEGKQRCWHNFVLCSKHPETVSLNALRWLGVDLLVITGSQHPRLLMNPDKDWKVVGEYDGYMFVKLNGVDPLISITKSVERIADTDLNSRLPELIKLGRRPTFIESSDLENISTRGSVELNTEDYRIGKGGVIDVFSNSPGYLLIKSQYYPGWKARASDEWVPILRADYLFQAIPVRAGHNKIAITYSPFSLKAGAWISLGGLLILFVVNCVLKRRKRQE